MHRDALSAALRLEPSVLVPGEEPAIWLVLRNTGTHPLRLSPHVHTLLNVQLTVHEASGERLGSGHVCFVDGVRMETRVRDLMVLEPRESREFRLGAPCGGLPRMPAGEYRVQATYHNAPDSPSDYDVYEDEAHESWDGQVRTAQTLTVLKLDPDTERELIATVEGPVSDAVESAINRLGLGRSTAAASALLRRFHRDRSMVRDVIVALAEIGDPATIAALDAATEAGLTRRAAERDAEELRVQLLVARSTISEHTVQQLVLAGGCAAIPLRLLQFVPASADTLLEQRCPDLRARLRIIRDTPPTAAPTSDEYRIQAQRASRARDVLVYLERPQNPPPAADPNDDEDDESPDPRKLGVYVRNLLQGSSEDGVAMRGLVNFGTKDTYLELRAALAKADDSVRSTISGLLEVVTFHEPASWQLSQSPRYWDSWWRLNGALSRAQWAEGALRHRGLDRRGIVTYPKLIAYAAEYLLSFGHNSPELVSRLARHRSWFVRLTVADTVAAYDQQRAGVLMIRELDSRYIQACEGANARLRELTRLDYYSADCFDPSSRRRAAAFWTGVLDERR